jgi:hypothetical protein
MVPLTKPTWTSTPTLNGSESSNLGETEENVVRLQRRIEQRAEN